MSLVTDLLIDREQARAVRIKAAASVWREHPASASGQVIGQEAPYRVPPINHAHQLLMHRDGTAYWLLSADELKTLRALSPERLVLVDGLACLRYTDRSSR